MLLRSRGGSGPGLERPLLAGAGRTRQRCAAARLPQPALGRSGARSSGKRGPRAAASWLPLKADSEGRQVSRWGVFGDTG